MVVGGSVVAVDVVGGWVVAAVVAVDVVPSYKKCVKPNLDIFCAPYFIFLLNST